MTELICSRTVRTPMAIGSDGEPFFDIKIGRVTSIPDPLGINGETLVGKERAGRPLPTPETPIADGMDFSSCVFCKMLPSPNGKAVSEDNLRPFGPLLHKVLFVGDQKHHSYELTRDDISSLYEELYLVADKNRRDLDGLDGVSYGMNCGEYTATGATQAHLHSQVTGILKGSFNAADHIASMSLAWYDHYRRDYLKDYEHALRHEESIQSCSEPGSEIRSNLIVAENEHALLYVPVAQRFRCELQIMMKVPGVANILDTTPMMRGAIAEMEEAAIRAHRAMGMFNFNTITYGSRFSTTSEQNLRFIVSISPRTAIIALAELLHRYVVDELPWACADRIRRELR
jgi:diadenosine tetraphosphate (Ap4A) HIT family hydrolase